METKNADFIGTFSFLARPGGLEPTTPRFVVWYSIQLSYGRMPFVRLC